MQAQSGLRHQPPATSSQGGLVLPSLCGRATGDVCIGYGQLGFEVKPALARHEPQLVFGGVVEGEKEEGKEAKIDPPRGRQARKSCQSVCGIIMASKNNPVPKRETTF